LRGWTLAADAPQSPPSPTIILGVICSLQVASGKPKHLLLRTCIQGNNPQIYNAALDATKVPHEYKLYSDELPMTDQA